MLNLGCAGVVLFLLKVRFSLEPLLTLFDPAALIRTPLASPTAEPRKEIM
jgi:hypothetical protein